MKSAFFPSPAASPVPIQEDETEGRMVTIKLFGMTKSLAGNRDTLSLRGAERPSGQGSGSTPGW